MSRCCVECFEDHKLRELIAQQGRTGNCDYCGSKNKPCVEASELSKDFRWLLTHYQPDESDRGDPPGFGSLPSPLRYGRLGRFPSWHRLVFPELGLSILTSSYAMPLHELLQRDWEIFPDEMAEETRVHLLDEIINSDRTTNERADVRSPWTYSRAVRECIPWVGQWRAFVRHIRGERRFIPNLKAPSIPDMKALIQEALYLVERSLPQGQKVYRARRGYAPERRVGFRPPPPFRVPPAYGPRPLSPKEMAAPPRAKTVNGGRINPPGIVVLYLAFDRDTAVAEVRPVKGDLVTVATYRIVRDVRVADLTKIPSLDSPFGCDDLVREVDSRGLLDRLSFEFAQPVDRDTEAIDYVPTQYAAEVIRDAGFDGIVYESALGKADNLVLFDPEVARQSRRELVEVRDVKYDISTFHPLLRRI